MIYDAIIWNADPEIINLFGKFSLRYYSLLFAGGLLLGYWMVKRMYTKEGRPTEELDQLAFYIFVGTVVGARLGHCLFYEPDYYLSHPLEMILPVRFEGGFQFTGFHGLASHGGIFGVFLAIFYFARKTKTDIFDILDKVSVAGALAGCFIRLGNFMNSEILGKPTGSDFGIIFKQVDNIPRHPGQLYESIAYFLIFLILMYFYRAQRKKVKAGFLFGLFFTLLFAVRFLIEFVKIDQVPFEQGLTFNMGQLLSIPFMLAGMYIMFIKRQKDTIA